MSDLLNEQNINTNRSEIMSLFTEKDNTHDKTGKVALVVFVIALTIGLFILGVCLVLGNLVDFKRTVEILIGVAILSGLTAAWCMLISTQKKSAAKLNNQQPDVTE